MAKPKTQAADVTKLTGARLRRLLADPQFAQEYMVAVANSRDDLKLRRPVVDLITALTVRHKATKTCERLPNTQILTQHIVRPTLPKIDRDMLQAFDDLVQTRNCNSFVRKSPDTKYPQIWWDVVGDKKRNWLFVVASNPTKKERFVVVTDYPGGSAISRQIFGMDAETGWIADHLAERLLDEHRADLV